MSDGMTAGLCPFDGTAPNDYHDSSGARRVKCFDPTCPASSFAVTIERWNRRAIPPVEEKDLTCPICITPPIMCFTDGSAYRCGNSRCELNRDRFDRKLFEYVHLYHGEAPGHFKKHQAPGDSGGEDLKTDAKEKSE